MKIARYGVLAFACSVIGNQFVLAAEMNRVIFTRIAPPRIGIFLADADGTNEHPLLPSNGLDYNASFSADGKWVLFTSERDGSADIYRVHPDGTGLERLTDSPAYDDQASLSPDGQTIAFVSTREGGTANIWLLDLHSHRFRKLTTGTKGSFRPSWSPDGKWIAFTSDRDTQTARWDGGWELVQSIAVYVIHPDGTGLRRITELGGVAGSPEWSPDGNSIVYYESSPKDVYPGRYANVIGVPDSLAGTATSQIFSIDLKTGIKKQLTSGAGLKLSPHYVQGSDLAYVSQSRTERHLAFVSGRSAEKFNLTHPSWSPDGKMMVYQRTVPIQRPFLRPAYSMDSEFELFLISGFFPAYSPSGDQIIMSGLGRDPSGRMSDPSGAGVAGQLWIMNPDGSQSHILFEAQGKMAFFPAWSPDHKSIAFGLGDYFQVGKGTFDGGKRKPSQIALINADGSNVRLLTNGETTNSGFPSWSPDGKQLVYRADGSGDQGLRILSIADGKTTTLTTGYDNFPDWSPRGDRIEFTRFADGRFSIYAVKPDGTDLRQLTNTDGNDAHAVWSPDGEWIVFSSSRRGWKDEAMLGGTTESDPFGSGPQPYGELFAMHADGTGVRQLTDNQWEDATATWMPSEGLKATKSVSQASPPPIH